MLRLTPKAAKAISDVVADSDLAEGGGLRIAATRSEDDSFNLGLSMESAPAEGDAVVELSGARVFLEPLASAVLEDRVLEAHEQGDELRFEVQDKTRGGDE
jgi:iron-sulfur cluster assembly protein